jgi:hypothetical protein
MCMRVKPLYDIYIYKIIIIIFFKKKKQLGEILGEIVKLFQNCFYCNEKNGSSKSCVNP